jgi:predicted transcriptional regulator
MGNEKIHAKIAEGLPFANTGNLNRHAKITEGLPFANTGNLKRHAKIAEGPRFANMGNKNAPKGARGSFILFSTDKRSEVLTGTPGMALGDVAKALGVRWKAISAEERAVYEQMAKEDKVRYANEMQAYNVKKNST